MQATTPDIQDKAQVLADLDHASGDFLVKEVAVPPHTRALALEMALCMYDESHPFGEESSLIHACLNAETVLDLLSHEGTFGHAICRLRNEYNAIKPRPLLHGVGFDRSNMPSSRAVANYGPYLEIPAPENPHRHPDALQVCDLISDLPKLIENHTDAWYPRSPESTGYDLIAVTYDNSDELNALFNPHNLRFLVQMLNEGGKLILFRGTFSSDRSRPAVSYNVDYVIPKEALLPTATAAATAAAA